MITIEEIKNYMVGKNIITNLAGVFRANNKDFVESESRYHATLKTLRVELPENMKPTLDEYIAACELDIISLVAYAGYLGFRVNLENYHSPVGVHFLHLDTIDYVKDHLMRHFPINYENAKVRDAFYEALPEACKEIHDTPSSKLPSYKAMVDLALKDDKVKAVFAEDRMAQASAEFADEDWQTSLELDRYGAVKDTLGNICTILRHDRNLQPIVFNQFKSMLDVVGELPWPQVKPGWNDTDVACAKLYFEKNYGIWSPNKFKDALLAVTSAERLYHPIKEYLATLKWDGVPRLDTLLIDYLGAEDNPYVRAVTRKTLVAAVARIYCPGIKFDSILVLVGPQGMGKSTLFAKLGGKWFSDSLSISDMKDKTAPEKLQGYWLLELSELTGMKKVDVEVVKSFITRTDDKYRHAYGTTVESHPRSCVIVGTTNSDGGFLRDITGNRRFWPVNVTGHGKHHPWELEDSDQIWAEAIEYYNRGEELFLKGDIAAAAYAQQREAMETDAREGIVQEYLDRLLPKGWDKFDLYQRRNFLNGGEFAGETHEGTEQRTRVCAMEIWCECFGKPRESLKKMDS